MAGDVVKTRVLLEDEPSAAGPGGETPPGSERSPQPHAKDSEGPGITYPGISNFQQSNANRAKK